MFDKITSRVARLAYGLNQEHVDPVGAAGAGLWRLCPHSLTHGCRSSGGDHPEGYRRHLHGRDHRNNDGEENTTNLGFSLSCFFFFFFFLGWQVELDTLAAETAASLTTKHPDYAILAARIAVSNLHKQTKKVPSGNTRGKKKKNKKQSPVPSLPLGADTCSHLVMPGVQRGDEGPVRVRQPAKRQEGTAALRGDVGRD